MRMLSLGLCPGKLFYPRNLILSIPWQRKTTRIYFCPHIQFILGQYFHWSKIIIINSYLRLLTPKTLLITFPYKIPHLKFRLWFLSKRHSSYWLQKEGKQTLKSLLQSLSAPIHSFFIGRKLTGFKKYFWTAVHNQGDFSDPLRSSSLPPLTPQPPYGWQVTQTGYSHGYWSRVC